MAEQQHLSFYSPHATSKAFYMHKNSSAFMPWALVILVTKPNGQKGWSNISAMGLVGGKETPVLGDALTPDPTTPQDPPSSPCIRATVTTSEAFPSLQTLPEFGD